MKWLVFRDIRDRINAIDLGKVVRIIIDHHEGDVYFWCVDGKVHSYRMDEVPMKELLEFLAVQPSESPPIVEHWSVSGGDSHADHDQDA